MIMGNHYVDMFADGNDWNQVVFLTDLLPKAMLNYFKATFSHVDSSALRFNNGAHYTSRDIILPVHDRN